MKIKVLVVDDSPVIREILCAIIDEQDDMMAVGAAPDPLVARDMIAKLNPDVLTLDIEMPHMNGLAFLKRLMAVRPMPVVMLSSFTQEGSDVAFQALSLGAVGFVGKPGVGAPVNAGYARSIAEAIRDAHAARDNLQAPVARVRDAKAVLPNLGKRAQTLHQVIAIGAGTGGMEALREIVTQLPGDAPPVAATLQIPPGIARHFLKKLEAECRAIVQEAGDGEPLLPGHVYLCPGDRCMTIERYEARGYGLRLHPLDAPPHGGPVDSLFFSVAEAGGSNACGIILTGRGTDGAEGLLALLDRGGHTIAQDEATSLVHGMPRAALEAGAVTVEAPVERIAQLALDWASWAQIDEIPRPPAQ